ncbi:MULTISPECIES: DMT family transporter [Rhizobium]|uniref:EamA family transporter n=1 Tax=Rhizobium tropici TaxID=398 RepID=A0A329YNZ9_RHITR|nr:MULTISPECIES: DMT family transporter [Rhizobium]MBB3287972.1 drug/metabolite transporter (DMT)-like permease [Rhizobium sp. BK252]MBB3402424.1 drug/metabolite transporter (DMT)-like permease [Rhizobium sp. BK289]MBB3415000.1 drug/metabolite transporter (DMT)-like permease [Rhizobium sp. BK284]MBB3482889.1 drug/metabolite transporter (DMT)-like permease [Rhizobium sp. BK347]MDK4720517.1 DMT family transporter [Rhizobium sp. CNPSo 3968]
MSTQPNVSATIVGVAGLAPLLTVLIWSGNTVVTKASAGVISPGSISFYRWLLAFVVLLPFVGRAAWHNRALLRQHWLKLATLGALGMVIYQSLAYEAAKTTSAVNMGVIVALMPLLSTFFASLLAGEKLTATSLIGGGISLIGLVYLTSQGDPIRLVDGGFHIGDGLMIIAVLSNALYGVMLRRWTMPIPMWQQLFWQIGFSTLLLIPIFLMGDISPITTANLPLILYAAIPTSLVAPLCWMIGIQRLGASRTSLLINLLPIIVAALAWALLGEQLHAYHAIGGALALIGVGLGLRKTPAKKEEAAPAADEAGWKAEEA